MNRKELKNTAQAIAFGGGLAVLLWFVFRASHKIPEVHPASVKWES